MFKIKEIETNVIYDDVYESVELAKAQIKAYIADDGADRAVEYVIIDENGEYVISLDEIASEAYSKTRTYLESKQREILENAESYISEWYEGKYNLDGDQIDKIAYELKILLKDALPPTDVEILMMAGSTEAEANKHLNNGSTVYPDLEENFDFYMQELTDSEEEIENFREMISGGKVMPDWAVVDHNGKKYFIAYAL